MKVGSHDIDISNNDKVFFPDSNITKGDLIDYYKGISKNILPHLEDRPLMLQRFPDGIEEDGFYQKDAADHYPDWIETKEIEKKGGTVDHVICNNQATLVYLVNQGTITFHSWLSKTDQLNNPDKFIIDLDPPSSDFSIVREAAFIIKERLDEIQVTPFLMTTGSEGLHIVIKLDGKADFDEARSFGQDLGDFFSKENSSVFTTASRKEKREGKLYFDVQRNAYAQTGVVPFSVRPIIQAPVATPIAWDELDNDDLTSQTYNMENIRKRLAQIDDPWEGMGRHAYSIKSLNKKLQNLKS